MDDSDIRRGPTSQPLFFFVGCFVVCQSHCVMAHCRQLQVTALAGHQVLVALKYDGNFVFVPLRRCCSSALTSPATTTT
jgi:hypothetical protein